MSKAPSFQGYSPSSERASKVLAKIKGANTKGEGLVRRALWKSGFRFRKNVRDLPGKPDIAFTREKIAVFCDGDFWHGRNWNKDQRRLKLGPNSSYWLAKIKSNIERDKRCNQQLEQMGWIVVRLWDSDIKNNPSRAALRVASILEDKRRSKS